MFKSVFATLFVSLSLPALSIEKIYFGSCSKEDKPMPIFESINSDHPELFVFLGDNVYGDTEDMDVLAQKYRQLGQNSGFAQLRSQTEVIAIWDDHDYGVNDGGREYPMKEGSRQVMLDFWGEPADSVRRTRPDGIYTSRFYGDEQTSVHVILPDLRWNRDPINEVSSLEYFMSRRGNNMGPYLPSESPSASMLGEKQWQWLEAELLKPSKIKIIGSSLQLLADFTGWEAWANFPYDRNRLLTFISEHQISGVILISGDTHWGEISKFENPGAYPLWEVTASGLSEEWKNVSPNIHRIGQFTNTVNYGFIEIDWERNDPQILLGLKNEDGSIFTQHEVALSAISFDR